MNEKGWTLAEVLIAVAIMGTIAYMAARVQQPMVAYFREANVRQRANFQVRSFLDQLGTALRNGKANTVRIDTVGGVPNSRIEAELFTPLGNTRAMRFWFQGGTRQLMVAPQNLAGVWLPGGPITENASALIFTSDYRDPAVVYVTLRVDAPLDPKFPNKVYSVQILNQEFHMRQS